MRTLMPAAPFGEQRSANQERHLDRGIAPALICAWPHGSATVVMLPNGPAETVGRAHGSSLDA
jgi:hypothetical protein